MYDVIIGYNEGCLSEDIGFYVAIGWDLVIGFGSLNFSVLVKVVISN